MTFYANTGDLVFDKPLLYGGKGNGLLQMALDGLPVPEALVLTTDVFKYYRDIKMLPVTVEEKIMDMLDAYPNAMFSVRSGAPVSMPGMMDTVLNVGVTPDIDDQYPGSSHRFYSSWLSIVHGVPGERIKELETLVNVRSQGDAFKFRDLYTGVVQATENIAVPQSRFEQVKACVEAVFNSWDTPRAKAYRAMHNIDEDMGTACIMQRMVMGTATGFSGSGVMFSRDPATGENGVVGEIAMNAQGEDVVSGAVTPSNIIDMPSTQFNKLAKLAKKLEVEHGDVQDIEFTFENGELYVLQTRTAKMSARARIVTACEIAEETYPNDPDARLTYLKQRVTRSTVQQTRGSIVDHDDATPDFTGLAASPGAVSGKVVFRNTPLSQVDKSCILVCFDTAPEDFPIMAKCAGILTMTGGFTCHSAVVARGIGVPAVVGCGHETLEPLKVGSVITIDGTTGQAWLGEWPVKKLSPPREVYTTLHSIIEQGGTDLPDDVNYYDCGLGKNVVLPLKLDDYTFTERQFERATSLEEKGKTVSFCFELFGLGEDMFDPSPETLFGELADFYYGDLHQATILYGVPLGMHEKVSKLFGKLDFNTKEVKVVDLLDLLGD